MIKKHLMVLTAVMAFGSSGHAETQAVDGVDTALAEQAVNTAAAPGATGQTASAGDVIAEPRIVTSLEIEKRVRMLDDEGQPKLDADGNPVFEMIPAHQTGIASGDELFYHVTLDATEVPVASKDVDMTFTIPAGLRLQPESVRDGEVIFTVSSSAAPQDRFPIWVDKDGDLVLGESYLELSGKDGMILNMTILEVAPLSRKDVNFRVILS